MGWERWDVSSISCAALMIVSWWPGPARAHLRPFTAFAKGLREWQPEMLAYFDEPTTNAYAEGVINKVKVIKRRAYGLPTFAGPRRRVVIACG